MENQSNTDSSAQPSSNNSPDSSAGPTCSCGHDRNHPDTETKGDYGFWGWLAMATGATVKPRKIHYICRRCGMSFDSTTDPDELLKHI